MKSMRMIVVGGMLFALTSLAPADVITFSTYTFQTVDFYGTFPADQSNNIDKFDVAGTTGNAVAPFDTTVYVRTSSSTVADRIPRRVQLYLEFDLGTLSSDTITQAALEFRAYSLNDQTANGEHLYVSQLANDWTPGGSPDPVFNPALVGSPIDAGIVVSGTGSDTYTSAYGSVYRNTTPYSVDVLGIVQSWQAGAANHGFHLELGNSQTLNQGIGLDDASVSLVVTTVAIPEPATLALLGLAGGILVLIGSARRK